MKYTTGQNMRYLIKNMWQWDKLLFLLSTVQGPMTVFIALLGIIIPKIILDAVIGSQGIDILISKLILPVLGLVILSVVRTSFAQWVWIRKILFRMRYSIKLTEKSLYTDYENIDGAKGQERYSLATVATSSKSF